MNNSKFSSILNQCSIKLPRDVSLPVARRRVDVEGINNFPVHPAIGEFDFVKHRNPLKREKGVVSMPPGYGNRKAREIVLNDEVGQGVLKVDSPVSVGKPFERHTLF